MRRRLTWAITALSVVLLAPVAGAVTEAEVQADIDTFQGYFNKRFPDVALADYAGKGLLDAAARSMIFLPKLKPISN